MTNNIRSTYNCITFLESSGQFDQTIHRDNIWGYFDYKLNQSSLESEYEKLGLLLQKAKNVILKSMKMEVVVN